MSRKFPKNYKKQEEEDEIKKYNENFHFNTDRIIEQSLTRDLSFNKDDSYSISNLKQDWDSIKLLQDDIKKTSEKLKQLGSVTTRPFSECTKTSKPEKKHKIEHNQSKELKKLQEKYNELTITASKHEKEKYELININNQLKNEIEQLSDINVDLKKQLELFKPSGYTKKTAEIMKYGRFFTKKLKEVPKWEELFMDRNISTSAYLELIKTQKFEESLLITLEFLSDIAIYYLKTGNSNLEFNILQEKDKFNNVDESESLLYTINAQSDRIAKLNKQISDAMISSKELLYSPLATSIKRDSRMTKSICFQTSESSKTLFSTPERWRLNTGTIQETNIEEEVSGKSSF